MAVPTLMLIGRETLGPGLGLGALRLLRFVKATSAAGAEARPEAGFRLVGRAGLRAVAGLAAVGGWARMVTIMGLTNMP